MENIDKIKEILYLAMKVNAKLQVRYVDYAKDQYSVPIKINEERISSVINDLSINEIKITIPF